jgi:hypothetical protein
LYPQTNEFYGYRLRWVKWENIHPLTMTEAVDLTRDLAKGSHMTAKDWLAGKIRVIVTASTIAAAQARQQLTIYETPENKNSILSYGFYITMMIIIASTFFYFVKCCRSSPRRAVTANCGTQTDIELTEAWLEAVLPPPPPPQATSTRTLGNHYPYKIYVSQSGARFHVNEDCRGLNNASAVSARDRCKICIFLPV